jgi:hypothetical protein
MAHKLIDLVADHADELNCRAEVEGIADLLQTGTGAHRQRTSRRPVHTPDCGTFARTG